jgi:hypothetical protein
VADETGTASDATLPEPPVGGFVLSIYKRIVDWKAQGRRAAMDVSVRIDCTPTETRRLIGAPDLLPLYEIMAVALEDWLVCVLARLDPPVLAPQRAESDQRADGGRSSAA